MERRTKIILGVIIAILVVATLLIVGMIYYVDLLSSTDNGPKFCQLNRHLKQSGVGSTADKLFFFNGCIGSIFHDYTQDEFRAAENRLTNIPGFNEYWIKTHPINAVAIPIDSVGGTPALADASALQPATAQPPPAPKLPDIVPSTQPKQPTQSA